ncbi:hypothetical protein LEP1GSC161_2028 [Leptospira santarosai str. CBC1416]|uniref:Uncharacterized protein n=1 Tax=Leptospira santarosai str. CBC1416 TaxID=1193059 RepID=M6VT40_9LEPT|nr:hypothetical protein LEP1GSC161_2028 [Leptospira santarosai str. CBC1416]
MSSLKLEILELNFSVDLLWLFIINLVYLEFLLKTKKNNWKEI